MTVTVLSTKSTIINAVRNVIMSFINVVPSVFVNAKLTAIYVRIVGTKLMTNVSVQSVITYLPGAMNGISNMQLDDRSSRAVFLL